jgi:hypothetical protein
MFKKCFAIFFQEIKKMYILKTIPQQIKKGLKSPRMQKGLSLWVHLVKRGGIGLWLQSFLRYGGGFEGLCRSEFSGITCSFRFLYFLTPGIIV